MAKPPPAVLLSAHADVLSEDFPCFPPVPSALRNQLRGSQEERVLNVLGTYGTPYTTARAYEDVRVACRRNEAPAKLLKDLRSLNETLKEANDALRYSRWLQKPVSWSKFAESVPAVAADEVRHLARDWFRAGREHLAHFRGRDLVELNRQLDFIDQWHTATKADPVPADRVQEFRDFRSQLSAALAAERRRLVAACVARIELASMHRASEAENSDVIYDVCIRLIEECSVPARHLLERIATTRPRKPESNQIFDQLFAIVAQHGAVSELRALAFLCRCGRAITLDLSDQNTITLATSALRVVVLMDQNYAAPRCANPSTALTLRQGDSLALLALDTQSRWACVRSLAPTDNEEVYVPAHLLADCFGDATKCGARLSDGPAHTSSASLALARLRELRSPGPQLSASDSLLLWRTLQRVYKPEHGLTVLVAQDPFQLEKTYLNLWLGHFGDAAGLLRSYAVHPSASARWRAAVACEGLLVSETWLTFLRSLMEVADSYHSFAHLELLLDGIKSHLTRAEKEVDGLKAVIAEQSELHFRWSDVTKGLHRLREQYARVGTRMKERNCQRFVSLIDKRPVEYYQPSKTALTDLATCIESLKRHVTADTYRCLAGVFALPTATASSTSSPSTVPPAPPPPRPAPAQFLAALDEIAGKQQTPACVRGALWCYVLPMQHAAEDFARQLDEPLLSEWLQARRATASHLCGVVAARIADSTSPSRLQVDERLLERVAAFQRECAQSEEVRRALEARIAAFSTAQPSADFERFLLAVAVPALVTSYACKKLSHKWEQRDPLPDVFLDQVATREEVSKQFSAVFDQISAALKPEDASVFTLLVDAYCPQLAAPLRAKMVSRQQEELERLLCVTPPPPDAKAVQAWWEALHFQSEWRAKYARRVAERVAGPWRADVAFLLEKVDDTKELWHAFCFRWLECYLTDEDFALMHPDVHPMVHHSELELSYARYAGDIVSLFGFYGHTLQRAEERVTSYVKDTLEMLQERCQLSINSAALDLVDVYVNCEDGLFTEQQRRDLKYQLTTAENIFRPAKTEVAAALAQLSDHISARQFDRALTLCQEKVRALASTSETHRRTSYMFLHALMVRSEQVSLVC